MFVASMVIFHMIALKNPTRSKMSRINQGTRKIMITRRTMTRNSKEEEVLQEERANQGFP